MRYDCLIVDDEKMLADSTAEYFNLFDIRAVAVYSAAQCLEFLRENMPRILLLDINLGDGNGMELCKSLRETLDIPIIFITARDSDDDAIVALGLGGDDYIKKPYSLGVLLAKVKATLRRYGRSAPTLFDDGRLFVDAEKRQLKVDGRQVKVTALEFKLLAYLIANRDRVVSKNELFDNVWGDRFTGDGTLNVHIRKIREAIERDPFKPEYISTAWGEGYRFNGGRS